MKPYERLASFCDTQGHDLGLFRVGTRLELRVARKGLPVLTAPFRTGAQDEAALALLPKLALKA